MERKKKKSAKWYVAVRRANKARRGEKRAFSLKRSATIKKLWAGSYGKRLRRERRLRWLNSEFKEKQTARLHSPKLMKQLSRKMRSWWENADNYEHMLRIRKIQANRPKERQRLSKLIKASWANPEIRRRMMLARKRQAKRPGEQERKRQLAKNLWADPKYRVKMMKSRKKTMYDLKWRESIAAGIKKSFPKGRKAWNKGLTKEDHPGLMKMSIAQRGQIPDYNKYRCWYPRENSQKIRMRSSWEVGYALYLDSKKIKWKYEPKSFYVGKGVWRGESYKPDFYLPATKTYHEVKGYQSGVEAKKLQAFLQKYPAIKLKVLTKTELRALGIINCYNKVIGKKAA